METETLTGTATAQAALPFTDTHHDPDQLSVYDALAQARDEAVARAMRQPTTADKARRQTSSRYCQHVTTHVEHENIRPNGTGDIVHVCDGCGRVFETQQRERVYL